MAISQAPPATTYQGARTVSDPVPMILLDLDAAGLDPTQPAPPDLVQFLYDNSQEGYLTLWSAHLSEPDMPTKITRWISDALAVYHARALQTQMAPPGDKPTGDHVTEVTYGQAGGPPVNVDIPYISGTATVGSILTCTMGNWTGEPTSYDYQWQRDTIERGANESSYTVAATDAGHTITCVVSASNASGTTTAAPSNAIFINSQQR